MAFSCPVPARRFLALLLGAVLSLGALTACSGAGGGGESGSGRSGTPSAASSWAEGMGTVPARDLPPEARRTLELIDDGGPFPYGKDGSVFRNFERELPSRPRGYYHAYTVPTPGSDDRGARRLVTGEGGETYWTRDHYRSFSAVLR